METLELPVTETLDEVIPPVNFVEQEVDLAAFELWREASCLDGATEQETAE
jgi:hypothetical protein